MKVEKISFSFDNGAYLDWERLDKPVISNEGKKMYWKVSNGIETTFTSGNPSVSYSIWLCDFLDELTLDRL